MENEKIFWDNDLKSRIENFKKYDDYDDIVFYSKKEMEEKELEKFKHKKEYVLDFIKDKKVVNLLKLLINQKDFLSDNKNTFRINSSIPSNLDFDLNENSVRYKIENLYDFLQDNTNYIVYYNYKFESNVEFKINLYNIKYDYDNKRFYVKGYKVKCTDNIKINEEILFNFLNQFNN